MKDFDMIMQRIEAAEDWRKANYTESWLRWYRQYRSQLDTARSGSNVFVPYTFMICEVVRARLSESLFSGRPYVSVMPRESGDRERADKLSVLLDWQLSERMRAATVFKENILQNMIVFGTAITYTSWNQKNRNVTRMEQVQVPLMGADGMPMLDEFGAQQWWKCPCC